VPVGIVVTVSSTENLTGCPPMFIWVQGELTFQSGRKLNLSCGSAVFIDGGPPAGSLTGGGGGGSSNRIQICGTTYWEAGDGDITGPTLFCLGCGLLPIELTSFEAKKKEDHVLLTWTTASERNNALFIVEHSTDGLNWQEINRLPGAGNSVAELNYSSEHFQPNQGTNYYRLSQIDFNGQFEIFEVQSVLFLNGLTTLYPNPVQFGHELNIISKKGALLYLYNSTGAMVPIKSEAIQGNQHVMLVDFKPGVYFLRIDDEVLKFVVIN
jgi:hypothetical protein